MKKIILFITLLFLLCISLTSAKTYHITLLTIGEIGDDTVGGTADAFLEVKPGKGRIFLDSFPLTKIDTQISTRYANNIACDHLDMDCSGYDFFYTIRAGSTIVGGPSASAALTVLTIAALKNLELREDTIMTGTINSGGSIGPVGGIVKKAIAAEKAGFKRVLIPMFSFNLEERIEQNRTVNETINITINITPQNISNRTVGKIEKELALEDVNQSIEVIKVSNIEQALTYFTDEYVEEIKGEIEVPKEYTATMKEVATNLCNRALNLHKRVTLVEENDINKSEMYIKNINKGFEQQDYYSAASYGFTLGVLLRKANLKELEEKHPSRIEKIYNVTKKAVDEFNTNLENINLTTLSELETYIIVKERLIEAEESLTRIANNISTGELAYAMERYYSAVYWSNFFKIRGKRVDLDKEYLGQVCYKKLSEAEERINYASLYIPLIFQSSRNTIKQAYAFSLKENYKMCLFKASFAKAESNLLLSSISVSKEQVEELAEEKLKAAKKVILKEQTRDIFPILGYSYYEYATSLKENNDPLSSLIFGEYSLELSNIEIYFPKKGFKLPRINYNLILLFISAIILGLAIGIIIGVRSVYTRKRKIRKIKKKRKKR
ncbi:hypothetical protein AYK26_04980 [Euryarchaeota archaeon SM23-78]|nr:MAG: hypothetical protein AYK26_04980 [Euryarchaeota archaeon SM23-78]MBW3000923.1 hypothetical protein [Candidatus Woesearchaeota archaeon]